MTRVAESWRGTFLQGLLLLLRWHKAWRRLCTEGFSEKFFNHEASEMCVPNMIQYGFKRIDWLLRLCVVNVICVCWTDVKLARALAENERQLSVSLHWTIVLACCFHSGPASLVSYSHENMSHSNTVSVYDCRDTVITVSELAHKDIAFFTGTNTFFSLYTFKHVVVCFLCPLWFKWTCSCELYRNTE